MTTVKDIITNEAKKELWKGRLEQLEEIGGEFTVREIAGMWGISKTAANSKMVSWEKQYPYLIRRNTEKAPHKLTFNFTEKEPGVPDHSYEIHKRALDSVLERLRKMELLNSDSEILSISPVEKMWSEQKQRGQLKILINNGGTVVQATTLHANGFIISTPTHKVLYEKPQP